MIGVLKAMPTHYAALHLVIALLAIGLSAAIARSRPRMLAAAITVGLVPLQSFVLARPRVVANAIPWADVVFFANFFPEIALALGVTAVMGQKARAARMRTGVLALALVGAAGYHASALYVPRAEIGVAMVSSGVVLQTQESSCGAAAAATLLRTLGIDPEATEASLAKVCLTDAKRGTTDLGLRRGLALAAPGRRVRFERHTLETVRGPCIAFVALSHERAEPRLYAFLRDECHWAEGEYHALVLLSVDDTSALVGDPRFGLERWKLEHWKALWDGTTLEVR